MRVLMKMLLIQLFACFNLSSKKVTREVSSKYYVFELLQTSSEGITGDPSKEKGYTYE